jgi:FkbM family methyltransferase
MTVFDVGANQGLYTVLASRRCGPNGRVVAFEPCRRERRKLRWNLLWNRCRNTVVRAEALGHVPAESAVLYGVVGQETGGNSLRPPAPDIATRCREERVAVTSLDVFCEQSGIGRVDFIKADVEGAEREVLQGAARVLSGPERPFVLWEVSDRRTAAWGYPARETVAYLSSLNYLLLEIGDGVLCVHKPRQEYDYTDLLAVPKEKARAFAVRAQRLGWVLLGHDNGAFC